MAQRADSEDILYADKQLVVKRTYAPAGLCVSGAIDVFNVDAFAQTLASSVRGLGVLQIDLRYLEFCDVSGIRALVSAAKAVPRGRRLVLIGLPQQLRTVMKLVRWNDLPGLVIAEDDEPGR